MVTLVSSPGYRTLPLVSEKTGILIQVNIRANIYRGHRIFKNALPFTKDQIGGNHDGFALVAF